MRIPDRISSGPCGLVVVVGAGGGCIGIGKGPGLLMRTSRLVRTGRGAVGRGTGRVVGRRLFFGGRLLLGGVGVSFFFPVDLRLQTSCRLVDLLRFDIYRERKKSKNVCRRGRGVSLFTLLSRAYLRCGEDDDGGIPSKSGIDVEIQLAIARREAGGEKGSFVSLVGLFRWSLKRG